MENLLAPAASLTDEQFRQQAVARTWAAGTRYLADTSIAHRPAHTRLGVTIPALATYTVTVWDLAQSTKAKPLGKFQVVAEAATAQDCLAELTQKLSTLEHLAYEADPCRYIDAQIESYQALEACA